MSAPFDEWRVCGNRVVAGRLMQGCTCNERDPSPWLVAEAIGRLARTDQEGDEPVAAPHVSRAARKAGR